MWMVNYFIFLVVGGGGSLIKEIIDITIYKNSLGHTKTISFNAASACVRKFIKLITSMSSDLLVIEKRLPKMDISHHSQLQYQTG